MTLLKRVQIYVKHCAETIANILKCEVEIVDEKLIRVAGTGIFENEINRKCEGSVYPHVFLTEESHIVTNPKKNELCVDCKNKDSCIEELEISSPIFYKGKVIGVIGLVCFNLRDKERILKNIDSYLKFTEQISDFISGKIFETEEEQERREKVDIFKQIINYFDRGIIVTDANGHLIDINEIAVRELKIENEYFGIYPKINIIPRSEKSYGKNRYCLEVNNNKIDLNGELLDFSSSANNNYKIFIFGIDEKSSIKNNEFTNIGRTVSIEDIIGKSSEVLEIKEMIKKIADSTSTVLITGESGTGKELIARAIHYCSSRRNFPFVAINCGAIPENLLESELFGYVKGAFSGASNEGKAGKFEVANNGVIFLDEIGEMPLYLQIKLLRVLQEKEIERLGSNKAIKLNVRVIAATNAKLEKLVDEKKFRKDLYYRLNVIQIELPPLRERKCDIENLLENLIKKYSIKFNKNPLKLSNELKTVLLEYKWPGNIRELENIVEYLVNIQDNLGNISVKDERNLTKRLYNKDINISNENQEENDKIISLEEAEKILIKKALNKYGNTKIGKNICAEKLGIGIATLYRKIEKYKIE